MLSPVYADDHDEDNNTPSRLSELTTTGIEVFQPASGASISLCGDTVLCPADDAEYMVFGYWIDDPESALGTYAVRPFCQSNTGGREHSTGLPSDGTARYTGSAVGVYVESAPFGSTDIDKRQGDFEAAVSLTATFDGDVSGWINSFSPMPRGDSAAPRTSNWRVTLGSTSTDVSVTGTATIDGLQSTGNWAAQFVQARTDAASAEPPAVVGVFKTSGQSLHLVGAFGAKQ